MPLFMQAIRLLAVIALSLNCSFVSSQELTTKPEAAKTPIEPAVCQEADDSITITIGKQSFLTYHKSIVQPPSGIDSVFQRSGYIHPIQTPAGREVTGDFAPDHAHQHAFFMAWVNTQFAGHDVDFWNQKKETGRVSHSKVVDVKNTDSFGEFEVELSHEDITTAEKPVRVLSERWKVRAYHRAVGQPFVFDFESHQTCVADSPLTLKKYHYGGFGLRGNQQWHKPNANAALRAWNKQAEKARKAPNVEPPAPPGLDVMGHDFLTSDNKQRHDGNQTRSRWTTIYGPVNGEIAGIAILSHPKNFRSPQYVRLHPAKPYFSYVPVVDGEFQIKPNETYSTRFRIVSYDGQPNPELLNQLWEEYSKVN